MVTIQHKDTLFKIKSRTDENNLGVSLKKAGKLELFYGYYFLMASGPSTGV